MSQRNDQSNNPLSASLPQSDIHTEEEKKQELSITLIEYSDTVFIEKELDSIEQVLEYKDSENKIWINIIGHTHHDILNPLAKYFKIHPLILEDIRTEQRPKVENYDDLFYIVLRYLEFDSSATHISNEQVSIVFNSHFVLSFHESNSHLFLHIKERLNSGKSKARSHGIDYLVYIMIDVIVDHYFIVMERMNEIIEQYEQSFIDDPSKDSIEEVYFLKKELFTLRRSIWPLREVIGRLYKSDNENVIGEISHYLRDVYDHIVQIIDTIESFRDMIAGIIDLHLSQVSQKTNAIMKMLAIVATVFAPLTFLTGIWGMNFKDMPDLSWKFGYPVALGMMILIMGVMLLFFKKKKWF